MIGNISEFIDHNYQHFNAAALKEAAHAYKDHLDRGGQMLVTLAGAMSTAELGRSLAEMIREGKVHAISCTGANLEEDLFNLLAYSHYQRLPFYRELSAQDEELLRRLHRYRVTDTCIPEERAVLPLEGALLKEWQSAEENELSLFPHEFLYRILQADTLTYCHEFDPKHSWLLAAAEKKLRVFVPGWEDSTLGNTFAMHVRSNTLKVQTVKTGIEYMVDLADWYEDTTSKGISIGFFQIGGGIAGDFPICVVPMLEEARRLGHFRQEPNEKEVQRWGYFCQISDSTTSYGSYSGAVPNEKITWGKLSVDTPKYIIESDASIVAPLIFAYVLGQ